MVSLGLTGFSLTGLSLSEIDRRISVRAYMIAAVLALAVSYVIEKNVDGMGVVQQFGVAVLAAVLVEEAASFFLYRIKVWPPSSAVITGLLVAGLLPFKSEFLLLAAASAAAIMSKHALRLGRIHLFNPANFGVLAACLVFGVRVDWWIGSGFSLYGVPALLLLLGGFITWKIRREEAAVSYIVVLGTLLAGWALFNGLSVLPTLSVVNLFFALFMLVDPATSPSRRKAKIAYGEIAAVVSFLALFLLPEFNDNIGLLAANASAPVLARILKE